MVEICPVCKKEDKDNTLFQEIEGNFTIDTDEEYHNSIERVSLYGCKKCGAVICLGVKSYEYE